MKWQCKKRKVIGGCLDRICRVGTKWWGTYRSGKNMGQPRCNECKSQFKNIGSSISGVKHINCNLTFLAMLWKFQNVVYIIYTFCIVFKAKRLRGPLSLWTFNTLWTWGFSNCFRFKRIIYAQNIEEVYTRVLLFCWMSLSLSLVGYCIFWCGYLCFTTHLLN